MTFLNDLWKKFKGREESAESDTETAILERSQEPLSDSLKKAENVLHAFQQNEVERLENDAVLNNLQALKTLVDSSPKEDKLELRFTTIKQRLGNPECHETLRKERWPLSIYCPNCRSENLKRLAQLPSKSSLNHRYRCLDCGTEFNDDSGTPMEREFPPLNVWMQCWYLMGCTESLSYIASKLGLELGTVEIMVRQLQKTFNAAQPLTRLLKYEEWSKQSQHLTVQLKQDLLRDYERLNANIATVPTDTAEHRRQLNLRRDLESTTNPSSPKGPKR